MKNFLLFFLLLLGLQTGCSKKPAGFRVDKVSSSLSYNEEWDVGPFSDAFGVELSEIFSQPFFYLAAGTQSYAFVSADQKYVLKFFKMKHLLPKNWLNFIPIPWVLDHYREEKIDRHIKRMQRLFGGYKKAYQELKKETGLVFIHLNKTNCLQQKLCLFDRKGEECILNADDVEFVLQHKVDLFSSRLHHLLKGGEISKAKEELSKIFHLIVERTQKGFVDQDCVISSNYGFIEDRPVHIDIGRLIKDENINEPERYQQELTRVKNQLTKWVSRHYPELKEEFSVWSNSL